MEKYSKKIISVIVLLSFFVSLFPISAYAQDSIENNGITASVKEISVVDYRSIYSPNEEFQEVGEVKVVYQSDFVESIPIKKEMVSGFDTSTKGIFTMTLTYGGKSVKIEYKVANLQSIVVNDLDKFSDYFILGDDLPEDVSITVYHDEIEGVSSTNICLAPWMLSNWIMEWTGHKTAIVNYGSVSTTFPFIVVQLKSITPMNIKSSYSIGEKLNSDAKLRLNMWDPALNPPNDTPTMEIPLTDDMLTGWDTSTEGIKTATVTYKRNDLITSTTTFDYTVTDPNHGGDDTDAMTVISTEKGIQTLMGEAIDQYFNLEGQALRTGGLDSTGPNFGQDIKAAVMESLGIETGNFDFRIYRNGSSNSYKVYIFDLSGKDAGETVEVTGFQYNNGNVSEPSTAQDITIISKSTEDAAGNPVDHLTINAEEFVW